MTFVISKLLHMSLVIIEKQMYNSDITKQKTKEIKIMEIEKFETGLVAVVTVGLFDQKTKKQEINTADALEAVTRYVIDHCGGGTITTGNGVYTHDDGTIVVEPSIIIKIVGAKFEQIGKFVKDIQTFLNQESVLVEITENKYCFVE